MRFLLKIYQYIGKLLQKHGIMPWEVVSDLPEKVPYVVICWLPVNPFTSYRPLVLSRADQLKGPLILHDSKSVDTRLIMALTENFDFAHGLSENNERVEEGDAIVRIGNKLKIWEKQYLKCRVPSQEHSLSVKSF